MATVSDVVTNHPHTHEAPAPVVPAGDPSLLGLPAFFIGSLALGLALVGYIPATAVAGILPIVMAGAGLGLLIATVWAASLAQSTVAGIFGVFTSFWFSYAALLLGLNHNWYAIPAADVTKVVGAFLICWAVLIGVLTLATLRLPLAFTAVLGLVTVALVMEAFATLQPQADVGKAGGYVVLLFAAIGGYLFLSASSAGLGGKAYNLGRPVQH